MHEMPTREEFQCWPTERVAELMRQGKPKVCVFPINGTRRWFMLEHPPRPGEDHLMAYLDAISRRHIELYRLLFDHGVETLLTPAFGPDLWERGEEYMQMAVKGMIRWVTHPDFTEFYDTYQVRVRFYGDHRKSFSPTPYAYLSDLFDGATALTFAHNRHRLFIGVCAQDAAETVAELGIHYYTQHGRPPDKRTLTAMYYGEYVESVDLFIGFDKFSAFDMPLVATGNEDLYFTVSPSPYLTARQLRDILYDHLFNRRGRETDYVELSSEDWARMRDFYHANLGRTLGVGAIQEHGRYWYPLPQVILPVGFTS